MGMTSHADAFGAITQCSTPSESATACEGALILPHFLCVGEFDYDKLMLAARSLTVNLNQVLDLSHPPTLEVHNGIHCHRAIAIGVQGLSDVLLAMKIPYLSDEAQRVTARIFKSIYFASATASVQYAKENGAYSGFGGSPLSNGRLNYDLWGQEQDDTFFNWSKLKKEAAAHGTANSVLTAIMPMEAMSQITGLDTTIGPLPRSVNVLSKPDLFLTGHVPFGSVIGKYGGDSISGYSVIHPTLVEWLSVIGMWNEDLRLEIVRGKGKQQ